MRSRRLRFALFAVIPLAASVFLTPPPARATEGTETKLLWLDQSGQPTGITKFYVSVTNTDGSAAPPVCTSGTCASETLITIKYDGNTFTQPLRKVDPDHTNAALTDPFERDLGVTPHYLTAAYPGKADAFSASNDELGLAVGAFTADPEPGKQGELVTFTLSLSISTATPGDRKPSGAVQFADNDGHASGPVHPQLNAKYEASWTIGQRTGRWVVVANWPGTDFFLPVRIAREHQVLAGEPGPTSANRTTTTRRPTATTNRSGTTVALAPINPGASTSTSLGETSTQPTFGAFPTTPRSGSEVAASPKKNEGPPIAVVVTTLLALGVLGGIAAFRRYRRSAIDWF
ncbi:MAG TPA: hypothetical protein VFB78_00370 [Acidimicrobiales bacterium]|nr:hypothetical protein [Acidimicrobiales bacterium]